MFFRCSTPPESLNAKESRMNEELLRSQVLRYKAEAEGKTEEIAELPDVPVPDVKTVAEA